MKKKCREIERERGRGTKMCREKEEEKYRET